MRGAPVDEADDHAWLVFSSGRRDSLPSPAPTPIPKAKISPRRVAQRPARFPLSKFICNSKKKSLQLFAKENFVNEDSFVLTVRRIGRHRIPGGATRVVPSRASRLSVGREAARAAAGCVTRLPILSPCCCAGQVQGTLDTSDGAVVGKAALRKKFFPGVSQKRPALPPRIRGTVSHKTSEDARRLAVERLRRWGRPGCWPRSSRRGSPSPA